MTGRQLIHRIVAACDDLDAEIKCYTLIRDEHGGVDRKYEHHMYQLVNGKLYVESPGAEA
jgi:hypothetical protein